MTRDGRERNTEGFGEPEKESPDVSAGLKDLCVSKGEGSFTSVLCTIKCGLMGLMACICSVRRADEGMDAKIQRLCCFPSNLWPWFRKQGREDVGMSDLVKPSCSLLLHTGSQGIMWGLLPLLAVCCGGGDWKRKSKTQ